MNVKEYERRAARVVDELQIKLGAGVIGDRAEEEAERARKAVRRVMKEARHSVNTWASGRNSRGQYAFLSDTGRVKMLQKVQSFEGLHLGRIDEMMRPVVKLDATVDPSPE